MKTIKQKVWVGSAAVSLMILVCACAGIWSINAIIDAKHLVDRAAKMSKIHMQADMMHDAIRGDVLNAMLSADPTYGIDPKAAGEDLIAHTKSFSDSIEQTIALAPDEKLLGDVKAIEPELVKYAQLAGSIQNMAAAGQKPTPASLAAFAQEFTVVEGKMEELGNSIAEFGTLANNKSDSIGTISISIMLAMLGLGIAFSFGLIWFAIKEILSPLGSLQSALSDLAKGKANVRLAEAEREDEIGAIASSVVDLQAMLAEKAKAEAAEEAQRQQTETEKRQREEEANYARAQEQAEIVAALGAALGKLSDGDLTTSIEEEFPQEFKQIREDFNHAVSTLQEALTFVATNASTIRTTSPSGPSNKRQAWKKPPPHSMK
jgi:methyl-accepting chemotaxis protein